MHAQARVDSAQGPGSGVFGTLDVRCMIPGFFCLELEKPKQKADAANKRYR
jgi:hypothetical protein